MYVENVYLTDTIQVPFVKSLIVRLKIQLPPDLTIFRIKMCLILPLKNIYYIVNSVRKTNFC